MILIHKHQLFCQECTVTERGQGIQYLKEYSDSQASKQCGKQQQINNANEVMNCLVLFMKLQRISIHLLILQLWHMLITLQIYAILIYSIKEKECEVNQTWYLNSLILKSQLIVLFVYSERNMKMQAIAMNNQQMNMTGLLKMCFQQGLLFQMLILNEHALLPKFMKMRQEHRDEMIKWQL
ncbi:unnamed protein product [Paramecium primaurelia]|uniref:Transmembrane protein n=1 Tax=Paramecium primaurelia TaxID=5886 RepID=A0A8S1N1K6_PARPR|nr:unnamed protein product [Paramecium primaurelia]CAD8080944.1 unnamed protein product [Paramecium primaurelia]